MSSCSINLVRAAPWVFAGAAIAVASLAIALQPYIGVLFAACCLVLFSSRSRENRRRPARMEGAVVGIVDMVASTRLSIALDLSQDFSLRRTFFCMAERRARQFGIQILNHTGDGFLFIANPRSESGWQTRLMMFYEGLAADFDGSLMIHNLSREPGERLESGLRCGVARGTVMLGFLGQGGMTNFTATGPVVNLAARICSAARRNEIVFSEDAWGEIGGHCEPVRKSFSFHEFRGIRGQTACTHVGLSHE